MTRAPTHRLLTLLLCACALLSLLPTITYGRVPAPEVSLRPPPRLRSRSLGYPWEGELVRGLRLRESQYVRYVPEYTKSGRFYGTWQLVQLLERAARRVSARLPGAKLSIGELSSKNGGDIDGHNSHESGRDADVGFFMTRPDGRPYAGVSFAQFDAQGRGLAPNGGLRFDDARNWELVAKLVDDADARVQYIFVANTLRQRLLREAARRKAPAALVARAASVLVEPAHGNPHRSHFHVRIYCAPSDRPGCLDVAPFWAWYPGDPRVLAQRDGLRAASLALRAQFGAVAKPARDPKRARIQAD
jgi:penicillin-insensitive murein endopeptidase